MSYELPTIIDYTKPPAPKLEKKHHPQPHEFRSTLEKDRYWDIEYERYSEGYAGLTGKHYFYIQNIRLLDNKAKKSVDVIWRDWDEIIFNSIDYAESNGYPLFMGKRREVGATSILAGCVPIYNSIMHKGMSNVLDAPNGMQLQGMFNHRVLHSYYELHPELKEEMQYIEGKKTIKFGVESTDMYGHPSMEGSGNEIYGIISQDDPTKFESYRLNYCLIDEVGIRKNLSEAWGSVVPSMMYGAKMTGFLAMCGTSGRMDRGGKQMKSIWQSAEELDIVTLFVPGTACMYPYMVNGHSDEKAAYEHIMKKREKYAKLEDETYLNDYKQKYPLTEEEMFSTQSSHVWRKPIRVALSHQEKAIMNQPPPIERGYLKTNANGNVFYTQNKDEGETLRINFYERPDNLAEPYPDGVVKSGIDPIPRGRDQAEEAGSKYAHVDLKGFNTVNESMYTPVSYFASRPDNIDDAIHTSLLLSRFWNSKVLGELDQGGDSIIKYFRKSGFTKNLMAVPQGHGDIIKKRPRKYWFKRTNDILDRQIEIAAEYLEKYADNIWFHEIVQQAIEYGRDKGDIFDALMYAIMAVGDFSTDTSKTVHKTKKVKVPIVRNVGGVMVRDYKILNLNK